MDTNSVWHLFFQFISTASNSTPPADVPNVPQFQVSILQRSQDMTLSKIVLRKGRATPYSHLLYLIIIFTFFFSLSHQENKLKSIYSILMKQQYKPMVLYVHG